MSKSSAIEFVKATDQVLLERVKAADSPVSVVKIAAEYGYELTEREMQAVLAGSYIAWEEDEELSEEQLESVAGGMMKEPLTCCCGGNSCVCQ
ncbi:Nif11-like leader peptide family natural product precursor [Nostoc sp. 106C]|uniref:Nif11-like leader peptide family natural product precursor n=1 Tax=Nostoc sp. 106C TaxID=1932667 RepID=UPI000A3A4EC6|nr:Nif11-like leader peptide family natural product precursor [Nostoc sp. 106C]OUL34031.1 hypothetical protein BV375_05490 [Nostoc sp. 106C]